MAGNTPLDLPRELDDLLRSEMAIEPSSGFLPRVRERISTPQRARWSWIHLLGGATAAAACTAGVAIVMTRGAVTPPSPPQVPALAIARGPAVPDGTDVIPKTPPSPLRPEAGRVRTSTSVMPSPTPAVIVDRRQLAALTQVIRMLREGRLTQEAFKDATPPTLQPIRDQVVPIDVKPLEVNQAATGGVLPSDK